MFLGHVMVGYLGLDRRKATKARQEPTPTAARPTILGNSGLPKSQVNRREFTLGHLGLVKNNVAGRVGGEAALVRGSRSAEPHAAAARGSKEAFSGRCDIVTG